MEKMVYSVKDVTELLGVSRSHVYELIKKNIIPTLDIGKRRVIPKKKFDAWINGEES